MKAIEAGLAGVIVSNHGTRQLNYTPTTISILEEIDRPAIYGLAANGESGVKQVIEMLKNELEQTIALAGCCTVAEITRNYVKDGERKVPRLLLAYGFFGYLENFGTSSPCFAFVTAVGYAIMTTRSLDLNYK